jgi:hypothetical protein
MSAHGLEAVGDGRIVCSVYVCGALFLETKLVKETLFAFPKQVDNIVDHSPLDHSPLGQR